MNSASTPSRSAVQHFSLVFGLAYLAIGLAGFAVTGLDDFAEPSDADLIVFSLNPLHNIVHILIGGAWIAASRDRVTATRVTLAIGIVLSLVTVLGLFGVLRFLSIERLGEPDNFLHLVTAGLALYFGAPEEREAAEPA